MNLNLKIKSLSFRQLKKIRLDYPQCDYWFDYEQISFFRELAGVRNIVELRGLLRGSVFRKNNKRDENKIISFKINGGIVKGAFTGDRCVGIILAGNCCLFPRLRNFNVFPPDFKSVFIGCIRVIPEYKDMGVDKRLLIEVEKELIMEKVEAIESIGRRIDDDLDEDEYENSPFIPFKFLINNGFYLKKNDPAYPLLRLDLKNIAFDPVGDKVPVGKVALERDTGGPFLVVKDRRDK